ncbi:MAG: hypothetical protein EHM85_02885 [Desulfobacteraceae bacterium]|nr:MAG: hypothetical protein EHM85_02885 [Desulfobacteraceae bacterium]
MIKTIYLVLCCLIGIVFSCANSKAEYEEVQKLQNITEQTIQHTSDYDLKIKACDGAINVLNDFVTKHKDGKWNTTATTALQSWESKKYSLQQEIELLTKKLSDLMNYRAFEEANKLHPGSRIEQLSLSVHKSEKYGTKFIFNNTYSAKMRGAFLGKHIFNFVVKVSGHIATDTKQAVVDSATIEE